uniref:Uncharacterized protein n=1 Tax=Arundo donax TaxID=35708 RepID=A0A0A9E7M5_ARUDO
MSGKNIAGAEQKLRQVSPAWHPKTHCLQAAYPWELILMKSKDNGANKWMPRKLKILVKEDQALNNSTSITRQGTKNLVANRCN